MCVTIFLINSTSLKILFFCRVLNTNMAAVRKFSDTINVMAAANDRTGPKEL